MSLEFKWANEDGMNGMPKPAELEADGWTKLRQHPNYRKSWLMRRDTEIPTPASAQEER